MNYYHLHSLSPNPADPLASWYEKAKRTWLCLGCCSPRPGIRKIDIYVDSKPDNVPLNFVAGVGVGYAKKEFLDVIGKKEVNDYLYLGKVFDSSGNDIKEFSSFQGKEMMFIRGNKKSTFRVCDECGRLLYFSMGSPYLIAGQVTKLPLYESQLNQLIVNEELYKRVVSRKWAKLGIEKLQILDNPRDGMEDWRDLISLI